MTVAIDQQTRCAWVTADPLYIHYHDHEWGKPVYSDQKLFELLILEGMQAGLSWLTALKKRDTYRACFDNFNPLLIAQYTEDNVQTLLQQPGIIKNTLKIRAIVDNAKAFLKIQDEYKLFAHYIWRFVDGRPLQNHWPTQHAVPTDSLLSKKMAKDLKKRGFKFVGDKICYAYMQAIGMVNDHTMDCFCYPHY